jgi:hypothetical protein
MFLTRLHTVDVPPNLWRLTDVLVWFDAIYGRVEIPVGTITDLGSTPQRLRRFKAFDPTGPSRRAAVVHDYLYAKGHWPDKRPVTQAEADAFLRVALIAEGVSSTVARLWWLGLRIGGWVQWRAYRKADADTGD